MNKLSATIRLIAFLPWLLLPLYSAQAYYDPGVQRWINRDPSADEDPNQYLGLDNAAVYRIDAWGEDTTHKDEINCLGYATDLGYFLSPTPGVDSLKDVLERRGLELQRSDNEEMQGKEGSERDRRIHLQNRRIPTRSRSLEIPLPGHPFYRLPLHQAVSGRELALYPLQMCPEYAPEPYTEPKQP